MIVMVNNIPLLIAFIALNAVFIQMYFGPLFAIPVEALGAQKAGIMTGFGNMFANIGGLLATYILGALKDTTADLRPAFIISPVWPLRTDSNLILARMRRRTPSGTDPPPGKG
jgi:sugar phosphate permease